MTRIALALFSAAAILAGTAAPGPASAQAPAEEVRVAAAADLKFALDEISSRLARVRPALRLTVTYGSSGAMHAQLRQRAPYDVFLSADVAYPRDLVSRGIGAEQDLFHYAIGRIVVWIPAGSRLAVQRDGLKALAGAPKIAIANPRHAPYGQAAEAALRKAGVWPRQAGAIVLGENVAQAAQFVQSGGADAGIIAKSLALAPGMRGGTWWEVPEGDYPPLRQGGLILPGARSRGGAVRFRDYLLGTDGRAVLAAHGFGLPAL
jgi:molybdate transport system substrate-binding protein